MERRKIDALVSMYKEESALRDVYVEGFRDSRVYQQWLSKFDVSSVSFIPIDLIDVPVPESTVASMGNKARVIKLATVLSETDLPFDSQVTCLCDTDTDAFFPLTEGPLLRRTDYSSIETYAFTPEIVERVSVIYGDIALSRAQKVFPAISDALVGLGCIYVTKRKLGIKSGRLKSPSKYLEWHADRFVFDHKRYIFAFLTAGGESARFKEFLGEFEELKATYNGSARAIARGHDFVDLVALALNKFGASGQVCRVEGVQGALLGGVHREELMRNPGFRNLLEWSAR